MHGLRSVSKAGVTAARTAAAGARRGRTLATKTRGIAKGQGAASRGQAAAASIPAPPRVRKAQPCNPVAPRTRRRAPNASAAYGPPAVRAAPQPKAF